MWRKVRKNGRNLLHCFKSRIWATVWTEFERGKLFFKAFTSFHLVGVRARRRKYGNFFKSFDASTWFGVFSESNWEFFLRSLIMAWTRKRANIANIKGIALVEWICWMEKETRWFSLRRSFDMVKVPHSMSFKSFLCFILDGKRFTRLGYIHRLNRFGFSKVSIAMKHGNSWDSLSWKLEFQQLNWNVGWSLNVIENVFA